MGFSCGLLGATSQSDQFAFRPMDSITTAVITILLIVTKLQSDHPYFIIINNPSYLFPLLLPIKLHYYGMRKFSQ